jgi:hypothetical protein
MAMEVAGPVRGTYNAEGRFFAVAGNTLFQITAAGVSVPLGTVPGVGRVSFSHNQITNGNEVLVNNGTSGYIYNTVTQVFQRITDASYPGGLRAVFINNRFVQIEPARRYLFNSALADGLSYTALDRFTSETSPDLAMSIESIGNQLAVFSSTTTEWFEDTGAKPQPFRSTGIVADKGAAGPFSTAKMDNQLFMLADDGVFYRYQGYNPVRISTKPIEQAIRNKNWFNVFTTVWEDSGYAVCYWTFPDGHTWGYDASSGKWHRRESYGFNRWRLNSLTYWQNAWYGGDFQNGRLWQLDWDYLLEGDQEFESIRAAGVISDNQNRVIHERLEVIMDTGMVETVQVDFVDQPEGPAISGDAPDSFAGNPYSFSYTLTPGDAPIARTILLPGSYVEIDGVQTDIPSEGWAWNQATATISAASPITGTMVHLLPRVIDTNGLFADHEDDILISNQYTLLVTGNAINPGDPMWATTSALPLPSFIGIEQSTGADISGATAQYADGVWCAANGTAFRYSDDDLATSQGDTIDLDGSSLSAIFGSPTGWVIKASPDFSDLPLASQPPTVFANSAPTALMTNGINSLSVALGIRGFSVGQYCFVTVQYNLLRTEDPTGTWVGVWDQYATTAAGWDPNGLSIQYFYDAVEWDEEMYAAVRWGFNVVSARYQIRSSPGFGTDWQDGTIVWDQPSEGGAPLQLGVTDTNTLVAYCMGAEASLRTSEDDFATLHPLGIGGVVVGGGSIAEISPPRKMACAGRYVFVIGTGADANKCVQFDTITNEIVDTYTLPINNAVSIASAVVP